MNILLTNDDSIAAQGILTVAEALEPFADVYTFAPAVQQSACGHGISLRKPLKVEAAPDFGAGKEAWSVDGTPADCVKIGLFLLAQRGIKMDMVFSGVNHGANLGSDVLYSGTAAGAVEGALNHIPAVALSLASMYPKHFDSVKKMAAQVLAIAREKLDCNTVLNINVPDLPWEEIKGIRITALGDREYEEWFHFDEEAGGYRYSAAPLEVLGEGDNTDAKVLRDGYIAITPLRCDMTNCELLEDVRSWGFSL